MNPSAKKVDLVAQLVRDGFITFDAARKLLGLVDDLNAMRSPANCGCTSKALCHIHATRVAPEVFLSPQAYFELTSAAEKGFTYVAPPPNPTPTMSAEDAKALFSECSLCSPEIRCADHSDVPFPIRGTKYSEIIIDDPFSETATTDCTCTHLLNGHLSDCPYLKTVKA